MQSEVIACPSCNHQLRVPETMFGTPVTCPECKTTFLAPTRQPDGTLGAPQPLPEPVTVLTGNPLSLSFPIITLCIVGWMALLANLMSYWQFAYNEEQILANFRAQLADPNNPIRKFVPEDTKPEDIKIENLDFGKRLFLVGAALGAVTLAGVVSMLKRRAFPVAVAGCVAAMVNVNYCCCFPGLPVGIWGLVRLFDPDIRASYRIRRT